MSDVQVREDIGVLKATIKAVHDRVDRHENQVLRKLEHIDDQLSELNEHMNKGKGQLALLVFLSGGAGAGLVKLLSLLTGG